MKNGFVASAAVTALLVVLSIIVSWFVADAWDSVVIVIGVVVALTAGGLVRRRLVQGGPRV